METIDGHTVAADMKAKSARPQFLTVLCILTWICCAFLFITTVWRIVFPETPEKQLEKVEQIRQYNPEVADQMEALIQKKQEQGSGHEMMMNGLGLIAIALSAYGVAMMWNMKRTGFFVYIAGELLPYFGFLFGGMEDMKAAGTMTGMGDSFGMVMVAVMLVFDGIFIAMYGVNLKHMPKQAAPAV